MRRRGPWRQALARFRRRPLGVVALLVVLLYVAAGTFGPKLVSYSEAEIFFQYLNHPIGPSLHGGHLLGTDLIGHDMLTRLLWAIRDTLSVAIEASLAALLVGLLLGAVGGYLGGLLDAVVGWLAGVVVTVPALVLYLVIDIHFNPPPAWALPVTLGACLWPAMAQAVRASLRTLRPREFVEAARASGASGSRIVFRHLLPNAAGTVVVAGSAVFGQAILVIASADFFGFAVNRPTLGGMIAAVAKVNQVVYPVSEPWWLWVIPILALAILLVCTNFTADTLADVLDPPTGR